MRDLRIVGAQDGALELVDGDGERFRLAIDDTLLARVRESASGGSHGEGAARKLSPREIQGMIRGGMSAHEVARITGADLDHILKFEGPVMAEREYVVETALAIPVHTAGADPLAAPTSFGDEILDRLQLLDAVGERWSAWKEATGWVVRLSYLIGSIEHDARWHFDPKRHALSPINAEAVGLSRQDPNESQEQPRLRAVVPLEEEPEERSAPQPVDRFDSDQFRVDPASLVDSGPVLAPIGSRPAARRESATQSHGQTADLLEALRRRRGERETPVAEEPTAPPRHATMRMVEFDFDLDADPEPAPQQSAPAARTQSTSGHGKRKGRTPMPSWDEIVFGARPDGDDDLA